MVIQLLLAVAVVLPTDPRPSESYAAEEYAAWVAKLTGGTAPALEIVRDDFDELHSQPIDPAWIRTAAGRDDGSFAWFGKKGGYWGFGHYHHLRWRSL